MYHSTDFFQSWSILACYQTFELVYKIFRGKLSPNHMANCFFSLTDFQREAARAFVLCAFVSCFDS